MSKKPVTVDSVATADLFKAGPNQALASRQIKQIKRWAGEGEVNVPIAAVSSILLALLSRNATACTDLCLALGDDGQGKAATMFRTNELRKWFIAQGPVKWSSSERKFTMLSEADDRWIELVAEYEEDEAEFKQKRLDTPFQKASPQAEFKGFDLDNELRLLLKKAEKIVADPDKGKDTRNNLKSMTQLRNMVSHLGGTPAKTDGKAVTASLN